jgi:hypothetical protein
MAASAGRITEQLAALRSGDRQAESILAELVLRRTARARPDHTLQPTALVNEAFVKLLRR